MDRSELDETLSSKMLGDSDGGLMRGQQKMDRLREREGPNNLLCEVSACSEVQGLQTIDLVQADAFLRAES